MFELGQLGSEYKYLPKNLRLPRIGFYARMVNSGYIVELHSEVLQSKM